jgi:hypothetical protein
MPDATARILILGRADEGGDIAYSNSYMYARDIRDRLYHQGHEDTRSGTWIIAV